MARASLKRAVVGGIVALAILVAGCATPAQLDKLKQELQAEIERSSKAQQEQVKLQHERLGKLESEHQLLLERSKNQEERVEKLRKVPDELEAKVTALFTYCREVEKYVAALREQTARQLDLQNAHIQRVKTYYTSVLEQHSQMASTWTKTLETTMAELKLAIQAATEKLKEPLPAATDAIAPPPRGEATPPAPTPAPAPEPPRPR